jgi:hypothetical protein
MPSATARDIAERTTGQRPDTVETDTPVSCQRQIAPRTSPAVKVTRRRPAIGSARTDRTTEECERTADVAVQQIRHRHPRPLGRDIDAGHTPELNQLPSSLVRVLGVTAHGERSLRAVLLGGVETDDNPDLPHPRGPLSNRSGAASRSA